MHRQVGAFREVLADESVRVLVGSSLPRAVRIAEVDLEFCREGDLFVSGEFGSLIPGQGLTQVFGQLLECVVSASQTAS